MRRLLLSSGLLLLAASCGGGGGLSDPDVHYRDFGVNVAVRSAPYLTPVNHKDGWGQSDCSGCHQKFKHSMATPDFSVNQYQNIIDTAVTKVGEKNAILVCSACHGTNGVDQVGNTPVQRRCLICHDSMDKLHFYSGTSSRAHFHDFNGNGNIDDFDCVVCHWQPDMDGIVEPDTDFGELGGTFKRNSQELCLTCHSNSWGSVSKAPLADTDGDGVAEEKVSVSNPYTTVGTAWGNDWHGAGSFNGTKSFKPIELSGETLFETAHQALECVNCHNPHASKNAKLIVERVGETLTVTKPVKQVDNTAEVKYVLVDPQTTAFFKDLSYEGIVEAEDRNYDLSDPADLKSYSLLPVENDDSSNETNRQTAPSLCAACHDGSFNYSPVNKLGIPIDPAGHYPGKCVECHTHGGDF